MRMESNELNYFYETLSSHLSTFSGDDKDEFNI